MKVVEEVVAKVVVVMVASGGCFSCPSHLIPSTMVGTQRPGCLDLIPTAPHNTRWRSWQHLGPEITLDGVCRVAKRESCRYPVRPTARHPARVVHGSISWPSPWVVHVQIILGHGFCAAVVRSVFRIVVCRQNTCKKNQKGGVERVRLRVSTYDELSVRCVVLNTHVMLMCRSCALTRIASVASVWIALKAVARLTSD